MRSFLYRSLFLLVSSIPLQAQKPNIVLILADDLGYSDLGCFGSEIETPHLDSLAANGLRFRSFYNTGRCSPSRAALLTGRYPHEVGVGHLDNDWATPGYRGRLDPNSPTVAETLKEAGYHTSMAGKWHLGKERPYWPIDRGFDQMFSSPDGGGYYFRPFETANRPIYQNETLVDLDDVQIHGLSSEPIVEEGPIAEYELSTSRASIDSDGSTASSYIGGTLGFAPSNTSNTSAHVYTLGAETSPAATHSFSVTPNGEPLDLISLTFVYLVTNIDFAGSSFSYEFTSSATGVTVLGSDRFTSSAGGAPDFSSLQSIDLSGNPSLQALSIPVTFTLTFTDNSSGTGRSHGISQMTLN